MDESMDQIERSAAHTLEQIREGGQQLLLVARERLREVEVALTEGRFCDAHDRAAELISRLQPLASAQNYMASFGASYVVRGEQVEEGMNLRQWGRVVTIERETHECVGTDHVHVLVTLKFENGMEQAVDGDAELIALRD